MHDDGQPASAEAPYDGLTPDSILDALAQVGLMPDGRMFALNSYENRVYQAGVEDSAPVVVKFYRPGRWTEAQIVEEHAFTAELAAAEIPVIAPLEIDGRTLHTFERWHFAVFPRCAGRVPAIDRDDTLRRMLPFAKPRAEASPATATRRGTAPADVGREFFSLVRVPLQRT